MLLSMKKISAVGQILFWWTLLRVLLFSLGFKEMNIVYFSWVLYIFGLAFIIWQIDNLRRKILNGIPQKFRFELE